MFHDRTRDLLIYEGPLPDPAWLPEAKALNGHWFAVPRTLHNCQVLRYKEFPVPPVITDENYDWPRHPSIAHPYESQKLVANFMVLHPHAFNFGGLGTGKTLTALWASDWIMQRDRCKALIIAELSTLEDVWTDNIRKHFLGRRTFSILHGSSEKRLRALDRNVDFYVINYDGVGVGARTRPKLMLDGFSKVLAERKDIQIVIADEAGAYRDASTKRHHIAQLILMNCRYLWLLTGTPTPNKPTDAYGLAKLVNGAHGKSFTRFRMETMSPVPFSTFRWEPKPDGYEKAKALLRPAIRIDIKEVWDGPPVTVQRREVPLAPAQKERIDEIKRDLETTLQSGHVIDAINEASIRTKVLQIACGAVYEKEHRAHEVGAVYRLAEIRSILEQANKKMLIFASFTSIVELLYKELKEYKRAIVYGETAQAERLRIFRAFQDTDDLDIIIANPVTMAKGHNLQRAQTVIFATPIDGKSELYEQAIGRANRPGQKFPVTVVQLVSTNYEREIFRRLETNASLQGALLDAVRKGDL